MRMRSEGVFQVQERHVVEDIVETVYGWRGLESYHGSS